MVKQREGAMNDQSTRPETEDPRLEAVAIACGEATPLGQIKGWDGLSNNNKGTAMNQARKFLAMYDAARGCPPPRVGS